MKRLIKTIFITATLAMSACTPTLKTDETVNRTIRIGTEQFTASLDSALEWNGDGLPFVMELVKHYLKWKMICRLNHGLYQMQKI